MMMKPCTICHASFCEDHEIMEGYIGILPVTFCPTCLSGLLDMADQMREDEEEYS